MTNETHDPNLQSWIESANRPDSDFPLQNLPVCKYYKGNDLQIGIAIGDFILDFEPFYNSFLADGFEKVDLELAASPKVRAGLIGALSVDAKESEGARRVIGRRGEGVQEGRNGHGVTPTIGGAGECRTRSLGSPIRPDAFEPVASAAVVGQQTRQVGA